jgi:hypothetical protein
MRKSLFHQYCNSNTVPRIGLSAMIQILLRGSYSKTFRRFAAPGLFVHSLLKVNFQRSFTKTPLRLRRKVFVNRIGFEPMTCCLDKWIHSLELTKPQSGNLVFFLFPFFLLLQLLLFLFLLLFFLVFEVTPK